jgi:hypothetical protein
MNNTIENYVKKNQIGSHCTSTSLRNILAYYGHPFTEDLCFGLGGGLGFSFYKLPEMQVYSFSGRARNLERLLCKNLGIYTENYYNQDGEDMWKSFNSILGMKEPILAKLDINNLEYMKLLFKINERIELGEHMAVLIGNDENSAEISEYFKRKPFIIEKSVLLESMKCKFEDKSLFNIFYKFRVPNNLIELPVALLNSIYYNSHEMMNGFGSSLGLPGLVKFMNEIFLWPNVMKPMDLKRNAYMAYVCFEKIGTGGGNFRLMYARFLHQAGELLKSSYLIDVANEYAVLAKYWKIFASEMYLIFLTPDIKALNMEDRLKKLCVTIKNKEKENIIGLNEWALKYYSQDIDVNLSKVK